MLSRRDRTQWTANMLDAVFILGGLALFLAGVAYTRVCESL